MSTKKSTAFALLIIFTAFFAVSCGTGKNSTSTYISSSGIIKGTITANILNSRYDLRSSGYDAPALGANVWLEERPDLRATTNTEGQYIIEEVPPGSYRVVSSTLLGGSEFKMRSEAYSLKQGKVIENANLNLIEATSKASGIIKDQYGTPLPPATRLMLWGETFSVGENGYFLTPPLPILDFDRAVNEIIINFDQPNEYRFPIAFLSGVSEEPVEVSFYVPTSPQFSNRLAVVTLHSYIKKDGKKFIQTEIDGEQEVFFEASFSPDNAVSEDNIKWQLPPEAEIITRKRLDGAIQETARWLTPFHKYTYKVSVSVTNSNGQTSTANAQIKVNGVPVYKVTYHGNENSSGTVPIDNKDYRQNSQVEVMSAADLEKEGHSFTGWNTKQDGRGATLSPGTLFVISTSDVDLYAIWKPARYSIAYMGNGNNSGYAPTDSKQYLMDDDAIIKNADQLARQGYSFLSWNTMPDGKGITYLVDQTIKMPPQNLILYAQWTINPLYPILYRGNGNTSGNPPVDKNNYEKGAKITVQNANDLVRTGYKFGGWKLNPDSLQTDYNPGDTIVNLGSEIILFANWVQKDSVTVLFDPNGGTISVPKSRQVTPGFPYNALATTNKSGYIFDGWFTKPEGGLQINVLDIAQEGDHVLYAHWKKLSSIVIFDPAGGTAPDPTNKEVFFNEPYGLLPSSTKPGHTFEGWYTEHGGGERVVAETIVATTSIHSLFAYWESNAHTLLFDSQGGSDPEPPHKTITRGETYGTLPTVSRTGYNFIGWFTEKVGGVKIATDTTAIDFGEHQVYAQWEIKKYSINFETNHGSNIASITVEHFASIPKPQDPEKEHFVFAAWYTDPTLYNEYDFDSQVVAALTLYARWVPKYAHITITYHANQGTGQVPVDYTDYQQFDEILILPLGNLKRDYFTFTGWNTKANGKGDFYYPGDLYTVGQLDVDLYAQWLGLPFDIKYEPNGGEGSMPTQTIRVLQTEPLLPNTFTYEGYQFLNWNDKADGTGNIFEDETVFTQVILGKTLYAQWIPNSYNLVFDVNGAEPIEPASKVVVFKQSYGLLPTPSREGHTFLGWFNQPISGISVTEHTIFSAPSDTAIYAQWALNKYLVTFDPNGGIPPDFDEKKVTFSHEYGELPETSRAYYNFVGWFTEKEGGDKIESSTIFSTLEPHTLYAQWAIHSFTTKYEVTPLIGGSISGEVFQIVNYNENTSEVTAIPSENYEFVEWSNGLTNPFHKRFNVSSNATYTAIFDLKSFQVLYHSEIGGNLIGETRQMVKFGNKTTEVTAQAAADYRFLKWEDGKTSPSRSDLVTEDKTYKALFIRQHLVSFNTVGGSAIPSQTIDHEAFLVEPQVPLKTGFVFNGWYLDLAYQFPWYFSEHRVTTRTTLYARWSILDFAITYNNIQGAVNDNPVGYSVDSPTILLRDPTKTGYNFEGWYSDPALTIPANTIPAGSSGNKVFYAKWSPIEYNITYHLNGGTNNPANPSTYNIAQAVNLAVPTLVGYIFDGWYADPEYSTASSSISIGSTGERTFYAKWEIENYNITYSNLFDALHTNPNQYNINTPTINLSNPTRHGYSFEGWYADPAFTVPSNSILSGSTGNKLFYANWSPIRYKITYNLDDGINNPSNPTYYDITETVIFQNPSRQGYTFEGWFKEAEYTNNITGIAIGSTGNTDVFAKWSLTIYNITYHLNGGSHSDNPNTYTYVSPTITLNNPSKTGFAFAGWYSDPAFTIPLSHLIPFGSTGDRIFYAKWNGDVFPIRFHANGGSGTMANQMINNGETAPLSPNLFTLLGHTFHSWNTDPNALGESFVDKALITQQQDGYDLYAQWVPTLYTITYNKNGGNVPSYTSKAIAYNSPYAGFPAITRTGYTLTGWYTEAAGGDKIETTTIQTTPHDHELYAQWVPNNYIVTFDPNGGTEPFPETKIVVFDNQYGSLAISSKIGHSLAGWFTLAVDGTLVLPETILKTASAHTLYAHWDPNIYYLNYLTDGNGTISGQATQAVPYKNDGTLVTAQPKTGYHFVAWDDGITTANRTEKNVTDDKTVTALFNLNSYTIKYVSGQNGSISGSTTQVVEHGSDATTVTAIPSHGYRFDKWSDGKTNAIRTDTNVSGSVTYTATFAPFAGGTGTSSDPYQINLPIHFVMMLEPQFLSKHFIMISNVALSEPLTPIGSTAAPFKGSLNGNGHKIINLEIFRPGLDNSALFAVVDNLDSVIKNLIFENAKIIGNHYTATVVAQLKQGRIENVHVQTNITSTGVWTGGIVGEMSSSTSVSKSSSKGKISSSHSYIGGIVGESKGNVSEVFSSADIEGNSIIGGIMGQNSIFATLYNSYSDGKVSAINEVWGGLVGNNVGDIVNCYSKTIVVGRNDAGLCSQSAVLSVNSYWDSETSGCSHSASFSPTDAGARTSEQLKQQSNFTGWNFSTIWTIDESNDYPDLLNNPR